MLGPHASGMASLGRRHHETIVRAENEHVEDVFTGPLDWFLADVN
jgi:hypothetical protein